MQVVVRFEVVPVRLVLGGLSNRDGSDVPKSVLHQYDARELLASESASGMT